jgi:signal peptidase II
MKKKYISFIIVFIIIVLIDQLTKFLVVKNLYLGESVSVINGFLNVTYNMNTGAAFGIFSNNCVLLILVSYIFLVYLYYEIKRNINYFPMNLFLTFIISGLAGNLIDRLCKGYIIDFIDVSIFRPVFNVSDIFICIGAILTIILLIMEALDEHKNKKRRNK